MRNALLSTISTLSGIITSVSFVHPENASPPISVTLSGITKFSRHLQLRNALLLIIVKSFGILKLDSELQSANARVPISVTSSGNIISVSILNPLKKSVFTTDPFVIVIFLKFSYLERSLSNNDYFH